MRVRLPLLGGGGWKTYAVSCSMRPDPAAGANLEWSHPIYRGRPGRSRSQPWDRRLPAPGYPGLAVWQFCYGSPGGPGLAPGHIKRGFGFADVETLFRET